MKNINNFVNEKLIINKDIEVFQNSDNEIDYYDLLDQLNTSFNIYITKLDRAVKRALDTTIDNLEKRKFAYIDPKEKHDSEDILIDWGKELIKDVDSYKKIENMKRLYIDYTISFYVYIFKNSDSDDEQTYVFFIDLDTKHYFIYKVI